MKTQLRFGSSFCGRHYSDSFKREDTTSGEGTLSNFRNSVFGRQYSTVRKREDTTSSPIENSVDCSETNVVVMPHMAGKCGSVVEAVCSIVFIIVVIESD